MSRFSPFRRLSHFALIAAAALQLGPAWADTAPARHPNEFPADARRFKIGLIAEVPEMNHGHYRVHREQMNATDPEPRFREALDADNFLYQFNLGEAADGWNFFLLSRDAEEFKFIGRQHPQLREVAILRQNEDGRIEIVERGLLSNNSGPTQTFDYQIPPVGSNRLTEAQISVFFQFSGSINGVPKGYGGTTCDVAVEGELPLAQALLKVKLALDIGFEPTHKHQVTISLDPFEESLPTRNQTSSLFEYIQIGDVKLAVEEIASDFSSITFVQLAGDIDDLSSDRIALGSQLPEFAQVDLLSRRMISRNELLQGALDSGWLVSIFGDPKQMQPQYSHMGIRTTTELDLADVNILGKLTAGLGAKPRVAFFVRSVPLSLLYEQYLDRDVDYLLLSDYDDPLRVQFVPAPELYSGIHQQDNPSTLSSALNLPPTGPSVVVCEADGTIHYVGTAANDSTLSEILVEANAAMVSARSQNE